MTVVIVILAYLKYAPSKGILCSRHGYLKVDGFTNANWVGNVTNRHSTFRYLRLFEVTGYVV